MNEEDRKVPPKFPTTSDTVKRSESYTPDNDPLPYFMVGVVVGILIGIALVTVK